MSKLVLVTGANGFVGRHLVARLLTDGHQVRALDKSFKAAPEDGAERIEADILDKAVVSAAMQDVEMVFHLAAITALWMPDEDIYQSVNVEGTHMVLEAAVEAKAQRFVHCSSFVTTITGPRTARSISENDMPNNDALFGAYARSKRRAEKIVLDANYRIEPIIVMPSAPLGPGDFNMTAPTCFIRDLANGKIPATIDQIINFVDVQLLADAIAIAGREGESGERYLLTGKNRDMRDFLTLMEKITGLSMPKTQVPYALAATASFIEEKMISRLTKKPPNAPYAGVRMAGRKFEFDCSKAMNDLDINLYPIEEALTESLLWLKKEGHLTRPLTAIDALQE
ncbi:MAG: NAD-dependent epimerase/dehydratase family protein [Hyphomicrobiales bacterium]